MDSKLLSIIGGEDTILMFLESSIPAFKSMLLDEIDRHTKEHGNNSHILYGIKIKDDELLTLNLIKKVYEKVGDKKVCKNIILAEMLTFNKKLVPSFFEEVKKFNKAFEDKGHKNLTLEIVKYIKNEKIFLVVALTPQNEFGICSTPIKIMPIDEFLGLLLAAKHNSNK